MKIALHIWHLTINILKIKMKILIFYILKNYTWKHKLIEKHYFAYYFHFFDYSQIVYLSQTTLQKQ